MTGPRADGKRALFSPSPDAARDIGRLVPPDPAGDARAHAVADTPGKGALFSTSQRRPGTVVVQCERCHGRSRIDYLDLVRRSFPLGLWAPWRRHARYLRCPACEERSWVKVSWLS